MCCGPLLSSCFDRRTSFCCVLVLMNVKDVLVVLKYNVCDMRPSLVLYLINDHRSPIETAQGTSHWVEETAGGHAYLEVVRMDRSKAVVLRSLVVGPSVDTSHCCQQVHRRPSCLEAVESRARLEAVDDCNLEVVPDLVMSRHIDHKCWIHLDSHLLDRVLHHRHHLDHRCYRRPLTFLVDLVIGML